MKKIALRVGFEAPLVIEHVHGDDQAVGGGGKARGVPVGRAGIGAGGIAGDFNEGVEQGAVPEEAEGALGGGGGGIGVHAGVKFVGDRIRRGGIPDRIANAVDGDGLVGEGGFELGAGRDDAEALVVAGGGGFALEDVGVADEILVAGLIVGILAGERARAMEAAVASIAPRTPEWHGVWRAISYRFSSIFIGGRKSVSHKTGGKSGRTAELIPRNIAAAGVCHNASGSPGEALFHHARFPILWTASPAWRSPSLFARSRRP